MNVKEIKAIIFDLGRVLIDFDYTIAAKKIFQFSNKSPEEVFDLFFDSGLTALFEQGKISADKFFAEVKEMIGLNLDYNSFLPIWNEIFYLNPKNQEVYRLAKALSQKYKMALLTNINILHFGYLKENFPIFDAFHYIIPSFELGFTKPDRKIYLKTLDILGVAPQEAFYTDDRIELIEKAQELGIRAFHFQGIDKLKDDLQNAGIKTGAVCPEIATPSKSS